MSIFTSVMLILWAAVFAPAPAQRARVIADDKPAQAAQELPTAPAAPPALIVKAPTGTVVWIDRLRYGKTGADGALKIARLNAGAHSLRARLKGKREVTQSFTHAGAPNQEVAVKFSAPASPAELRFQTGEELREAGKHKEAIKEYRQALALNKRGYAAARIGLARSLMASEDYEEAITEARRAINDSGGRNAEASTVLGNTRRFQGLYDQAITNYQTAIAESRNALPEAHTGLALTFQDRNRPDDTIKHLRLAAELSRDTEPIIYFLLGSALEREVRNQEALEAYEKYLLLEPQSRQAAAVRSIIKQLRRTIQWK
jgi:tetratricopeptide (TPR) repeat protein